MKDEPELIDLFAMFIVQGLLEKDVDYIKAVETAYQIASAMMVERRNWT